LLFLSLKTVQPLFFWTQSYNFTIYNASLFFSIYDTFLFVNSSIWVAAFYSIKTVGVTLWNKSGRLALVLLFWCSSNLFRLFDGSFSSLLYKNFLDFAKLWYFLGEISLLCCKPYFTLSLNRSQVYSSSFYLWSMSNGSRLCTSNSEMYVIRFKAAETSLK